jgi:kelch-like protein 18
VLEQLINYSYNGKITITNENVQPLLVAANFFQMDTVKKACCNFIKKRLCKQDALCLKSFAEHLMCRDLLVAVNRFINLNFASIARSPEFLELGFTELSDVLQRDELNVDCEEQVSSFFLSIASIFLKNQNAIFIFESSGVAMIFLC